MEHYSYDPEEFVRSSLQDDALADAFSDHLPQIAPDYDSRDHLVRSLVATMCGLQERQHKQGVIRHILDLHCNPTGNFSTRYEQSWTFPDGYQGVTGYTIFSHDEDDKAIVGHTYLTPQHISTKTPVALLDLVQGRKGREVQLEAVTAQVIASWQQLYQTGWKLLLCHRETLVYKKIRDRFFQRESYAFEDSRVSTTLTGVCNQLDTSRQRVQGLLGIGAR